MCSNDAKVGPQPVSLTQRPSGPTGQFEQPRGEVLLDSIVALSKINSVSVVQHGAHLAVMGELLASVVAHLPYGLRADIVASFRGRVEALMSHWDDRPLPEQFHSAFLSEVNRYLGALR